MTIKCSFLRAGFELGSPDYQEKVLSTMLVRDHQFIVIWAKLYVVVRHMGPPRLGTGFPQLIEKLSQLWKGRAVEDALPGEEGGAVKLECPECGKEWLRPAGGWEQCGWGGGVAACNRSRRGHHCKGWQVSVVMREQDLNSDLQITKKRCYPLC